jgi:alpha-N-arabinofuranosidase
VVNVEGRGATAQEAADWVQYVNGPPDSPMGKLRAQNGHPQPYGVRIWEVGNEIWGTWVRGHSDAATYARNLNRYVAAMRAVDPTIKIVGVGDNNMNWNRTVLGEAGRSIDYLAIHHYYGLAEMAGDARNLTAHPLFYERFYQQVRDAIHELVPGHDIKLAINEWNTSLPLPRQHSMESALYGARLMNVFERSGDLIAMSAVSDMVNGWSGGVIQASRDDVFVTPTYLAIKLYNDHLGSERVPSTVESPTFDTTKEGKRVPYLDVVATRSAGGKQLFIHAVNADAAVALLTTINVAALRDGTTAALDVLNGPTLDASNTFRAPDTVRVQHSEIPAGPHFTVELPAHSVAVITIPLS